MSSFERPQRSECRRRTFEEMTHCISEAIREVPEPPLRSLETLQEFAEKTSAPHMQQCVARQIQRLVRFKQELGQQKLPQNRRRSMFLAFVSFVLANLRTFAVTIVASPIAIIGDPLSTIAILFIFQVIYTILTFSIVTLWMWTKLRHLNSFAKFTGGGTEPSLDQGFTQSIQEELLFNQNTALAIRAARVTLAGLPTTIVDVPEPNESEECHWSPKTTRVFNLDVAKTLSRFLRFVKKAFDRASHGDFESAKQYLLAGDQAIREQTLKWDLNYESISNLGSPQGAFGSVFYTKVGALQPFMMLVFKGTTPTNYSEFLVDCTLTRVDATTRFGGGTVHKGFATQLFPMFGVPGVSARDGYGQMTYQLKRIARQLLAHHPYLDVIVRKDLGPHVQLRDCYTFGGSRAGDAIFTARVGSEIIKPINRPNILWRVQNRSDIVCRVPPNASWFGALRRGVHSPSTSILNYCHFGIPFELEPHKCKPHFSVDIELFHHLTRVDVIATTPQPCSDLSGRDLYFRSHPTLMRCLLAYLTPQFILDHRDESYMIHLNRIVLDVQDDESRCRAYAVSKERNGVAEAPGSPASLAESSKAAGASVAGRSDPKALGACA